jgi:transposase
MVSFEPQVAEFRGPRGALAVPADDEISRKLAMLLEGECGGLGPTAAARKYGYSRQRYYQLRRAYLQGGARALQSEKRGPKRPHRRTTEAVRQVIRHRFLDPDASTAVIAQKLQQSGVRISRRSVERVVEEFGLQKRGSTGITPPPRLKP